MNTYDIFLKAIHEKWFILVEFSSMEKGIVKRKCIPFDYGPSRKSREGYNRYHFYDLDSPDGPHNLSILPEQLLKIEITEEHFEPQNFIHWKPNWFIRRDWGEYS